MYLYCKLIIFLVVLLSGEIYSIDTTAARYYPLVIGNIYVYRSESSSGPTSYTQRFIIQDSVFNGHRYYKFRYTYTNSKSPTYSWERVDSVTTNILKYDGSSCILHPNESMVDSLVSSLGSYIYRGCGTTQSVHCNDTSYTTLFGIATQKKSFMSVQPTWIYLKDIGFFSYRWQFGSQFYGSTILRGCVLNGILYGDTTMPIIAVNLQSNEIPKEYKLYNNYPNPFNPETKIKFDIPENAFVKMEVFDAAGRLTEQILNREMNAGYYETGWDGSKYSSGIYFYRISAGKFTAVKKMVMVK